jgi:hypothetical protein
VFEIGIDIHQPHRGAFRLSRDSGSSVTGLEFALTLRARSDAELRVVPWYNPYLGPWTGMPLTGLDQFYNVDAALDRRGAPGVWDSLFVATNRFRVSRDGSTFPVRGVNRGRLRHGRAAEHSLADWYADAAAGLIEIRLPWNLLNVTDPSSRQVLHRVTDQSPFPTVTTDGLRFAVAVTDRARGTMRARIPATSTFTWRTWEEPVWHERLKPAYYAMQRLWGSW